MSNSNDSQLSDQQQLAIQALLLEPTIRRAALAIDVSERTIYRWFNEPPFKQALEISRRQALPAAIEELRVSTALAMRTLREVMGDHSASPSARVTAALSVLRAAGAPTTPDDGARAARPALGDNGDNGECHEMADFPDLSQNRVQSN
jgi:hypothetical protein